MKGIFRCALAVVLMTSCSGRAWAAEAYRMEIESEYFQFENDDRAEWEGYRLIARQYFSLVSTKGHPLAEAAFLERIGGFGVTLRSNTLDQREFFGTVESDQLSYGAFVTFRQPHQPLFLHLSISQLDSQEDTFLIGDFKSKGFLVDIGRYLSEGHIVDFEYTQTETEGTFVLSPALTFERKSFALKTKVVKKLGMGRAANLQAEVKREEFQNPSAEGKNMVYALGGDYYFNRSLGLGGVVSANRGDDKFDVGETFSAALNVFLTPAFSLGLSFEAFQAGDAAGFDSELISAELALRL